MVFGHLSIGRSRYPPSAEWERCAGLITWTNDMTSAMSESDSVDEAVQRVREAFENVVNETEEMSEQAKESVEEAVDDSQIGRASCRERVSQRRRVSTPTPNGCDGGSRNRVAMA